MKCLPEGRREGGREGGREEGRGGLSWSNKNGCYKCIIKKSTGSNRKTRIISRKIRKPRGRKKENWFGIEIELNQI